MNLIKLFSASLLALGLSASVSLAAAKLRANIEVTGSLVTLNDLFKDAGKQGNLAVFRAPSIGQTGTIRAERVILAARQAGLGAIDQNNVSIVRVHHASQRVTEQQVTKELLTRMRNQGFVSSSGDVEILLNQTIPDQHAAFDALPAYEIRNLRFDRVSGRFSGRILIGGRQDLSPIRFTGQATETIMVPMTTRSLARGEIIAAEDIALTPMPKRRARNAEMAQLNQLIGKAARQNIRQGSIATRAMFKVPEIVNRSDVVTILLKAGKLTLTMRGTALSPGAKGDVISVQNDQTNRIIRARIKEPGLVQVDIPQNTLASLKEPQS